MSFSSYPDTGQLLAAAAALSAALAQGKRPEEIARLAAFFTLVGDTLAVFALQPQTYADGVEPQGSTPQDTP